MSPERVRLNFMLSSANAERLDHYKAQTGRSRTEVIRQLVVDFIQGFTEIEGPTQHPQDGQRADLYLTAASVEMLEAQANKHGGVSAVVNGLLDEWLPGRLRKLPETVDLKVPVPVGLYNLLTQLGDPGEVMVRLASEAIQPQKQAEVA